MPFIRWPVFAIMTSKDVITTDILHCALLCIDAATPPAAVESDMTYQEKLEGSIQALDVHLKPDDKILRQNDDEQSTATELAASCRAACSRLLAIANTRAVKRINTSLGVWRNPQPFASNSHQGLEARRLKERIEELRLSLVAEIGKSLRYG